MYLSTLSFWDLYQPCSFSLNVISVFIWRNIFEITPNLFYRFFNADSLLGRFGRGMRFELPQFLGFYIKFLSKLSMMLIGTDLLNSLPVLFVSFESKCLLEFYGKFLKSHPKIRSLGKDFLARIIVCNGSRPTGSPWQKTQTLDPYPRKIPSGGGGSSSQKPFIPVIIPC